MARSKYINTFNTTAEYDNYIESAYPEFPNVGYDKEAGKVKIMRTSPNDHILYGALNDPTQVPQIRLKYGGTTNITCNVDSLNNTFYLDLSDIPSEWRPYNDLSSFMAGNTNITSIKKNDMVNSNVTSLSQMFYSCSSLTKIDCSSFDTSNVISFYGMFEGCSSLTSLDLSSFDTSKVIGIARLFSRCDSLKVLDLSNWTLPNISSMPTTTDGIFMTGLYQNIQLTDVYITDEHVLNLFTNNLTSSNGQGAYVSSSATIHYNDVDYKWQNNAWTPQS